MLQSLRGKFRCHTTGSDIAAGRSLCHTKNLFVQILHYLNQLRIRIRMRIIGIQSIDVRQKDQQICPTIEETKADSVSLSPNCIS